MKKLFSNVLTFIVIFNQPVLLKAQSTQDVIIEVVSVVSGVGGLFYGISKVVGLTKQTLLFLKSTGESGVYLSQGTTKVLAGNTKLAKAKLGLQEALKKQKNAEQAIKDAQQKLTEANNSGDATQISQAKQNLAQAQSELEGIKNTVTDLNTKITLSRAQSLSGLKLLSKAKKTFGDGLGGLINELENIDSSKLQEALKLLEKSAKDSATKEVLKDLSKELEGLDSGTLDEIVKALKQIKPSIKDTLEDIEESDTPLTTEESEAVDDFKNIDEDKLEVVDGPNPFSGEPDIDFSGIKAQKLEFIKEVEKDSFSENILREGLEEANPDRATTILEDKILEIDNTVFKIVPNTDDALSLKAIENPTPEELSTAKANSISKSSWESAFLEDWE